MNSPVSPLIKPEALSAENLLFVASSPTHSLYIPNAIDPRFWDQVHNELERSPFTGDLWEVIVNKISNEAGVVSQIFLYPGFASLVSPTMGRVFEQYVTATEVLELPRPQPELRLLHYPADAPARITNHNDNKQGVVLLTPSNSSGILNIYPDEASSTPLTTIQAGIGDVVLMHGNAWHSLEKLPETPARLLLNLSLK